MKIKRNEDNDRKYFDSIRKNKLVTGETVEEDSEEKELELFEEYDNIGY